MLKIVTEKPSLDAVELQAGAARLQAVMIMAPIKAREPARKIHRDDRGSDVPFTVEYQAAIERFIFSDHSWLSEYYARFGDLAAKP